MNERQLKNLQVWLVTGVSKKGFDYNMLQLRTGIKELDKSLKPVFLSALELKVLIDTIEK